MEGRAERTERLIRGQDLTTEWRKSGTAQVVGIAQGEEYKEEDLEERFRRRCVCLAL